MIAIPWSFPLLASQRPEGRFEHAPKPRPTEVTRAISVLVIDDDVAIARMVRLNLLTYGFSVQVAHSGIEGLDLVERSQPDVILLDLQMPQMNGRQVYRELRARGVKTPVIILSAFDAAEAMAELGAQAAFKKPFKTDELVASIRDVVGR